MRVNHLGLHIIGVMLVVWGLNSWAASCPIVSEPSPLQPEDQACLQQLKANFRAYSAESELPFLSIRNTLLSEFPFANQKFIIDSFYVNYCQLLGEERFALSEETQVSRLAVAKDKLYKRVPFPPTLVDTRNISVLDKGFLFIHSEAELQAYQGQFLNVSSGKPVVNPNSAEVLTNNNAQGWLRDPPFYITKANKYFVIVSSVKSYESARQEVARLKRKTPQYDFVAYAPYGTNSFHAIMLATWLSHAQAQEVLLQAQKWVNKGSFIWSCPSGGESC